MNKIKRVLAVCAAFTLTCAVADFSPFAKVQTAIVASALNPTSDITVNRENNDENELVLHISGSGEVTSDDLTDDDKANAVHLVIDEGITSIGFMAFYEFKQLKTVKLPESLINLGGAAFGNCKKLESINLNEDLVNLKTIEKLAFSGCGKLNGIQIPKNVTTIGPGAFKYCKSIADEIEIPDGVDKIDFEAFYECNSLASVSLPESVTEIGDYAFLSCWNLKSVNLPKYTDSLGKRAFYECRSLESEIVIPSSLKCIGWESFRECESLKSVVISEGVEQINEFAFCDCTSLENVTLPENINIRDSAFQNTNIKEIVIPNGCSLLSQVFRDCKNLKSVVLPNDLTRLPGYLFYGCTSLETVNIPSTITSIESNAFYDCTSLETVNIPPCVEKIQENAFSGCTSLKYVNYEGTSEKWNNINISDGNDELINAYERDFDYNNILSGMKLNLADDGTFDIKLYIDTWNTAFGKDSELKVTGGKQDVVTVTDLHECEEIYGRDFAVYTIDGIAMKDMADEYDVKVITTDGSTKTQTISVKDYANAILADENQDAKTKELVKRLFDLGGCAQEYFGYKTDSLVNDGLVLDREVGIADNAAVNGTSDGLKYVGSTLVLNDKIAMRHYFKQTDDYRITKHKATLNGESAAFVEKSEDLYYIEITDCSPLTYGDQSTCVIDGTQTIKYSVNDYIAKVIINSADYKLVNVVKALYHYGEAAKAYVG